MKIHLPHILLLLLATASVNAGSVSVKKNWNQYLALKQETRAPKEPNFLQSKDPKKTAEQILSELSTREKIGQLFMVAAYSNRDESHYAELKKMVVEYGIGGLIFFQGGPQRQLNMLNALQKEAKIPLLIGIDAEWGLDMRLDSTFGFQRQMTLGATQNPILVQDVGAEIGRQCKNLGIHVNFAPVCDINSNANNPVINTRSFGEDRFWVAKLSTAYARGMEGKGIMACAKHFPGHGDTDSDSHKTLPTVGHTLARLDSVELYPFKKLFDYGISSVMVAHLNVPAMEPSGLPSTLSKNIVKTWLKDSLKFSGLVFTDALNMKGVADAYPPGVTDLKALQAGADVLLFPLDVPKALNEIEAALNSGQLSMERLDNACLKILKAKQHFIHKKELPGLNYAADAAKVSELKKQIAEASITLLKNKNGSLPFDALTDKPISILLGDRVRGFESSLSNFSSNPVYRWENPVWSKKNGEQCGKGNQVILALGGSLYKGSSNYGFGVPQVELIQKVAENNDVHLLWFGNPYALKELPKELSAKLSSIIIAYEAIPEQFDAAAAALFGKINFNGKLPVSISSEFKAGSGLELAINENIKRIAPEWVGMSSDKLMAIDDYVEEMIEDKAMPGCQIVVLRKGKEVYHKSFGHYTYAQRTPVSQSTLYDLASLTKVLSSSLACMKLVDEGKLDIQKNLGHYLDFIPLTNPYHNLRLKDIMLHQAGLPGWIPYFKEIVSGDSSTIGLTYWEKQDGYEITIANNYYASNSVQDWMWQRILREPLRSRKDYLYSDIGFYFLKEIIERLSGEKLEDYVRLNFYQPMDLKSIGYNPLERFDMENIAPTEYDALWRKQLVQGTVHDQGAALLGGVGGHAGLFANAEDVASIMQMLLNGGSWKEKQLLKQETVAEFTRAQNKNLRENRRGLIFDKPVPDGGAGPTFNGISLSSFGHSGFTGTLAWADPQEEIVYVFLSNRVYPSSENKKLIRNNVRSKIHEMIYASIIEPKTSSLH
ncbi:MAG: glycoside hydrolase family 3 N-terminal domain-containing protein [Luteibaculum sp.]